MWCIWFVSFVWLNQTDQMNQINKTNQFQHPAKVFFSSSAGRNGFSAAAAQCRRPGQGAAADRECSGGQFHRFGQWPRTSGFYPDITDGCPVSIYFTGILITIAPMTSLILKSRFGLSGWELWQPMHAWATARSG